MSKRDEVIVANLQVTASETFAGEAVVIHFDRGTYFSLRGSAPAIWSFLQEPTSIAAIVSAVQSLAKPLSSDFESRLAVFVAKLAEEDLIVNSTEPARNPAVSAETVAALAEPPNLEIYTDLAELIAMDPVHEIDILSGWPKAPPQAKREP